jgi:hypothetical protein
MERKYTTTYERLYLDGMINGKIVDLGYIMSKTIKKMRLNYTENIQIIKSVVICRFV